MLRRFLPAQTAALMRSVRVSHPRSIASTHCLYDTNKDDNSSAPEEKPTASENDVEGVSIEALQSKVEELKKDRNDLNDKLLRALADAENVRHISRQDVQNAREYSIAKFAKNLLDVADNLQRAHESINVEEHHSDQTSSALKSLHEGVVMTDQQLQKVLREFKINPIGAIGDRFDPNMHDALFEYTDSKKESGTIGQLMKRGYTINSRVLRPAQVGVVKADSKSNKTTDTSCE